MTNDSDLQNRTFDFLSPSEYIAWLTVFGIEAFAIVTLNALTIIVWLKERRLRKRSLYLTISLAVADMLNALSLILLAISWIFILRNDLNSWKINFFEMYTVIAALISYLSAVSVTNLAAISLERVHATFRPHKHRLVKKKVFGAAVAAIWLTASVFTAIGLSHLLFDISRDQAAAVFISFLSCCVLIILVSYTSIATKFYGGTHPQRQVAISRERKLTKTLFIVTAVSLILLLPINIFSIVLFFPSGQNRSEIIPKLTGWHLHLMFCFSFLFYANSFTNPLLYAWKIPEFKRALLVLLRCRSPRSKAVHIFPFNDI